MTVTESATATVSSALETTCPAIRYSTVAVSAVVPVFRTVAVAVTVWPTLAYVGPLKSAIWMLDPDCVRAGTSA